ncbi:MAG: tetratricopeptide repeat protein [bacterium]
MMRYITISTLILIYSLSLTENFEYFASKGIYKISALMLFAEDIDEPIRGIHYLYQGDIHLLAGRWNTSLLNYRLFLFINPMSSFKSKAIFNLGRIYYINKDKEKAKDSFIQSNEMGLNGRYAYNALSYLSALYASEGSLSEADRMYNKLFSEYPEYLHTSSDRYRHSQIQIALGKYKDATLSLQMIDSMDYKYVDSRFYLSKLLYHLGESEKAIETIESIIKIKGEMTEKDKQILLYYASLLYKKGLKDKAKVILERLIEADIEKGGNDIKARLLLGFIEFENGNFKRVSEILGEISESLIVENSEISYLLSLSYYRQGLLKEAEFILLKSLNANPENEKELYLLGWIYFRKSRYKDSEVAFNKVSEKGGPLKYYSKFMVSECLYKQCKYDTALSGFTELIKTEVPSNLYFEAILRIADSKFNKGEIDDAIKIYNDFVFNTSSPKDLLGRALYSLGKAYYKKGEIYKSTQTLENFLRNFPNDENCESVIIFILDTLEEKEDHGGIIKFVEKNGELFSKMAVYRKMLISKGRAYYQLGLYKQANSVFNELLTNYPNTSEAVEAEYYTYMVDYHLGKYKTPLSASEEFLVKNPDSPLSPAVRLIIAKYYLQSGDYNKAENLLIPIIEGSIDESSAEAAAVILNTIYTKQGKVEKLGEIYKTLAKRAKTTQDRIKMLIASAISYTNAGIYEEAINIYSGILNDYPEGEHIPKTLYNLGLLYKDAGLYQNARVIFEQLVTKYKGGDYYAQGVLHLAFVYQHLGNINKAIEYHKIVIGFKNRSLSVQSTYWLADCYYNIGNKNEALKWLNKLFKEYTDFKNWIEKGEELKQTITYRR